MSNISFYDITRVMSELYSFWIIQFFLLKSWKEDKNSIMDLLKNIEIMLYRVEWCVDTG